MAKQETKVTDVKAEELEKDNNIPQDPEPTPDDAVKNPPAEKKAGLIDKFKEFGGKIKDKCEEHHVKDKVEGFVVGAGAVVGGLFVAANIIANRKADEIVDAEYTEVPAETTTE